MQRDVDYTPVGLGKFTPNVTKIWGHSHNDEMQGKDAFVSLNPKSRPAVTVTHNRTSL